VDELNRLRSGCALYFHGHTVGGTNLSLIEAMAAGAVVCAHDNPYNRWVLADAGWYFSDADSLIERMEVVLGVEERSQLLTKAEEQCRRHFMWDDILVAYENLVLELQSKVRSS
jgi:glycosyltransferase involved in cell wall biosynthesis